MFVRPKQDMSENGPIQFVETAGFDADRKAADEGRVVVLHEWSDGWILGMYFDSQMPAFTAQNQTPEEMQAVVQQALEGEARVQNPELTATGYVFAAYEPAPTGTGAFDGKRFSLAEIIDYVLWTDDAEIRSKYQQVLADA